MTPIGHAVYLHGFASSPASSKAVRFGAELARCGVGFTCPDLNLPDFTTLTVTRMLAVTHAAIAAAPRGPVALIGSSLGAFVAVHAAAADVTHRVDRLVLLAPAFDFGGNRLKSLGDQGVEQWQRDGHLRVFHHAWQEFRDVAYALYADAAQYDAFALALPQPTLIVHGRHDDVVDRRTVEAWARDRPNIDLHLVDDGHQLGASMELIWSESQVFLGLA